MKPLLGKALSEYIFRDESDEAGDGGSRDST